MADKRSGHANTDALGHYPKPSTVPTGVSGRDRATSRNKWLTLNARLVVVQDFPKMDRGPGMDVGIKAASGGEGNMFDAADHDDAINGRQRFVRDGLLNLPARIDFRSRWRIGYKREMQYCVATKGGLESSERTSTYDGARDFNSCCRVHPFNGELAFIAR
jgi:hypothetical protein